MFILLVEYILQFSCFALNYCIFHIMPVRKACCSTSHCNKEASLTCIRCRKCDVCDKAFGKRQYLHLHMVACYKKSGREPPPLKKQLTPEKNAKPLLFVCKSCNRAFSNRHNMVQHTVSCGKQQKATNSQQETSRSPQISDVGSLGEDEVVKVAKVEREAEVMKDIKVEKEVAAVMEAGQETEEETKAENIVEDQKEETNDEGKNDGRTAKGRKETKVAEGVEEPNTEGQKDETGAEHRDAIVAESQKEDVAVEDGNVAEVQNGMKDKSHKDKKKAGDAKSGQLVEDDRICEDENENSTKKSREVGPIAKVVTSRRNAEEFSKKAKDEKLVDRTFGVVLVSSITSSGADPRSILKKSAQLPASTSDGTSSNKANKGSSSGEPKPNPARSNTTKKLSPAKFDSDDILCQLSPSDEAKEEEMSMTPPPTPTSLALGRPKRNLKPKTFSDGTVRVRQKVPEVVRVRQADGSQVYKLRKDVQGAAVTSSPPEASVEATKPSSVIEEPKPKDDVKDEPEEIVVKARDTKGMRIFIQGESVPLLDDEDEAKVLAMIDVAKLVCLQCKRQYGSASNLRRHAVRHLGWRRYKCKLCKFTSYNKSECKSHLRKCHNNEVATLLDGGLSPYIIDLGTVLDDSCEDGSGRINLSLPTASDNGRHAPTNRKGKAQTQETAIAPIAIAPKPGKHRHVYMTLL